MLQFDPDFRLVAWQGETAYYGIGPLETGADVRELLPMLYGLSAGEGNALHLVEAPNGRSMDLVLLPEQNGLLLLITDSTAERERQQEAQQHANEIMLLSQRQARLLEALEQANRTKGRFIAAMSHEFRTPLAAIKGQVELQREPAADVQVGLAVIDANATHLLSLIDNILDQAKIESGQLELNPLPTDMRALVQDLRRMFEPLARRKDLSLRVDLASDCPWLLVLDAPRLRQVLVNLLGNAYKFTREGGVSLRLQWEDGRLKGVVEDTGPGIPEDAQQRIFQAFHQEPGVAASRDGVGLGLAISAQLVALMGGRLGVQSALGKGSVFRFTVDTPVGENDTQLEPAEVRVLVADDSIDLRLLLLRQLLRAGFQVEAVGNGNELMAAVADFSPQLVLLDLYLGEENGGELALQLRADGFSGGILMLSAASSREERQQALDAGCDDFLVKPVPVELLQRRLLELAGGV